MGKKAEPDTSPDAPISRSARKRAHQAIQKLGVELMELSPTLLERLALPGPIYEAVTFGRTLSKGARARHVRHLANILLAADVQRIEQELAAARGDSKAETARLHRAEGWRDRLIDEGDCALSALVDEYPFVDRHRVRDLVRAVHRERARDAPRKHHRQLLRYLREVDQQQERDAVYGSGVEQGDGEAH